MKTIVSPGVSIDAFISRAPKNGFSMQSPLFDPALGPQISGELELNGELYDLNEQNPTELFGRKRMAAAKALHSVLNSTICSVTGKDEDHLPYFSVRVFEPGVPATTIHRNHPAVGPWTIGITLRGMAPFSVYDQSVLPLRQDQTIPLKGEDDPTPLESIEASPGAGWILYPKDGEQTPHSGGLVHSAVARELLILYGLSADN